MSLKVPTLGFILSISWLSCATILPEKERKYNISVHKIESLSSFLMNKKEHAKGLVFYEMNDLNINSAMIKYYSTIKAESDSYLVCAFSIERDKNSNTLYLNNISYTLDYRCDNRKSDTPSKRHLDWCLQTRGIMGPTSLEDKEKYMIPCVKEFLLD
ncbi:hypothetical protein EHO59_07575 [Leptospira semungkisensis]|uniref:Lipoprotein n=1 Tax=Leptospira semungkisensis TaxID=2484985 RepID=A0A4R9G8M7_9LEPT|nr:hypothetical protein [Leptospira semungkisensis]TGK07944.1 hypothetical protein EHO59_07575 [Leptospira semungkisensis]